MASATANSRSKSTAIPKPKLTIYPRLVLSSLQRAQHLDQVSIYLSHCSPPLPLSPSAAPQVKQTRPSRTSSPENSSTPQSNLIADATDDDQVIRTSPTQKPASEIFALQENSPSSETSARPANLEAGLRLTINAIAFRFEPADQAWKENQSPLAKSAAQILH